MSNIHSSAKIHPMAVVHPNAKIGANAVIDQFATIYDDVTIGEGTWIAPNAVIFSGARIGKNCKIFPGASISAVPQDLKFDGEVTTTEIGDNTVIRECVTISRGTKDKYTTKVGRNCLLMAYVHVAHDCIVGNNCIIANSTQIAGHVVIADWVILGGSSAVHQFVHIGAHVMISGGSLVRKDVPPFTKAGREPLSYAGINSIGLRRRGFSEEKINEIQEIYRTIYLRGYNNSQALEKLEKEFPYSEEKEEIIRFIAQSERGVMKGGKF